MKLFCTYCFDVTINAKKVELPDEFFSDRSNAIMYIVWDNVKKVESLITERGNLWREPYPVGAIIKDYGYLAKYSLMTYPKSPEAITNDTTCTVYLIKNFKYINEGLTNWDIDKNGIFIKPTTSYYKRTGVWVKQSIYEAISKVFFPDQIKKSKEYTKEDILNDLHHQTLKEQYKKRTGLTIPEEKFYDSSLMPKMYSFEFEKYTMSYEEYSKI